jgi:hypothetical protein
MKTKTLVIFYLILILTGIAINCSSKEEADDGAFDKFNEDDKTKPGKSLTDRFGTANCFENLSSICSLYYSGKVKMA